MNYKKIIEKLFWIGLTLLMLNYLNQVRINKNKLDKISSVNVAHDDSYFFLSYFTYVNYVYPRIADLEVEDIETFKPLIFEDDNSSNGLAFNDSPRKAFESMILKFQISNEIFGENESYIYRGSMNGPIEFTSASDLLNYCKARNEDYYSSMISLQSQGLSYKDIFNSLDLMYFK